MRPLVGDPSVPGELISAATKALVVCNTTGVHAQLDAFLADLKRPLPSAGGWNRSYSPPEDTPPAAAKPARMRRDPKMTAPFPALPSSPLLRQG